MSNQIILWSMFIVPWLTLFFMKRQDIKRYIPAALFAIVTSTIIHDAGIRLGFWVIRETIFPLNNLLPHYYGLFPVLTMWILKFTNGRFWIYMATNAIVDLGFAYLFLGYYLPIRGIADKVGATSFRIWLFSLGQAFIIYIFQKLQEGEPIRLRIFSLNPQPAATKPFIKEKADKNRQ